MVFAEVGAADAAAVPGGGCRPRAGQQIDSTKPTESRSTDRDEGASDTLLVLFEDINGVPRFLGGDDDSGEDRNARALPTKCSKAGTTSSAFVYYPGQSGRTSLMYS